MGGDGEGGGAADGTGKGEISVVRLSEQQQGETAVRSQPNPSLEAACKAGLCASNAASAAQKCPISALLGRANECVGGQCAHRSTHAMEETGAGAGVAGAGARGRGREVGLQRGEGAVTESQIYIVHFGQQCSSCYGMDCDKLGC